MEQPKYRLDHLQAGMRANRAGRAAHGPVPPTAARRGVHWG
jgi:hypothetical protein